MVPALFGVDLGNRAAVGVRFLQVALVRGDVGILSVVHLEEALLVLPRLIVTDLNTRGPRHQMLEVSSSGVCASDKRKGGRSLLIKIVDEHAVLDAGGSRHSKQIGFTGCGGVVMGDNHGESIARSIHLKTLRDKLVAPD